MSPKNSWALLHRGFLGVDLFFVISGFLIVTLLLRERRRTGTVSLRNFYARRFLRIFPLYYAVLAVVLLAALLTTGKGGPAMRHDLPYAFAYVSNLVPMMSLLAITWSLSTEEQFYFAVPALEKHLHRYMPLILPLVYVLVSLPPFGLFPSWNLPGFFRQTTFGPILLGVMLAHGLDNPRGYAAAWRLLHHRLSPVMAAALFVMVSSWPTNDISGWPRIASHLSMVLLVAACVLREQHALRSVLLFWPVRRIGIVSYGIYLLHELAMHIVNGGMKVLGTSQDIVKFVGVSLATWALAEASYRLYESRFLAHKSRFAR